MSKIEFTDDVIQQISIDPKVEKKAFTSSEARGLQLIVMWKGSAVRSRPARESYHYNWYLRYPVPETNKRAQIKLGSWPGMSCNQAIDEATRLNQLLAAGIDPRSDKLKARAQQIDEQLKSAGVVPYKLRFENVVDAMGTHWPSTGKDPGTFYKYRQALEKHAYPAFVGRNIKTISGKEWDNLIADLAHIKKMPGAASNTHKAGRRLFSFAVEQELLQYNPLLQRKASLYAARLAPDERFLESSEVHTFLNQIDSVDIPEWSRVNLKLMMIVGVRVEEWERVRIGWIRFDKMRIEHPAESMKNRTAAWTHLPKQAIEILLKWLNTLKEQFGPLQPNWYLFPSDESPTIDQRSKLSDHTWAMRETLQFSPKLIRKTISTHLQRHGCPPTVLRAIRNQSVTRGVESHYDFDDLFHLKKQWIEKWCALLDDVKENPKALQTERDSELDSELSTQVADLFK